MCQWPTALYHNKSDSEVSRLLGPYVALSTHAESARSQSYWCYNPDCGWSQICVNTADDVAIYTVNPSAAVLNSIQQERPH